MYKPNAYPFDLISPATIIWRPPPSPTLPNPPVASKKGKEKEVPAIDTSNTTRTIWIRSHPSVFDNIFQSLKDCISETLSAVPGEAEEEIELSDLRDSVNAFDVMGPKASQVIKGALRLVKGEDREELKKVSFDGAHGWILN
jgi:ribonuclease P/MRP protein subunit POP1